MKTRVLLADDHPPLLEAAAAILKPHFDVVGVATDGAMLVSEVLRLHPDVIVTDITMPVLSGIDAVRRLREFNISIPLVFLTVHAEEEFLKACLDEGALGYVVKSRMKAHLVPAIEAALTGRSYISPFASK
jgi:DNA-binding NarL/FixJ family response regulator